MNAKYWLGTLRVLGAASCRAAAPGPYSPTAEVSKDTTRAQELNVQAADAIPTDLAEAERSRICGTSSSPALAAAGVDDGIPVVEPKMIR